MTSESSYAVELKIAERGDDPLAMFQEQRPVDADEKIRRAFEWLMSLVVDQAPAPEALTLIKRLQQLRQRYGKVLEILSNNSATISVRTRTNPRSRRLSQIQARERLKQIRELGYPFTHLTVRGRLIGGLVEKSQRKDRSFTIRVEAGDKSTDYSGAVSDEAVDEMLRTKFGDEVEADLRISEADKEQVYILTHIRVVTDKTPHSVT